MIAPRVRRAMATVAVATGVLAACGGGAGHTAAKRSAANAATATPAAERDIEEAGAKRIHIKGDWLAAGAGGIWLSGESDVFRLDPASGRRTATVPVAQGPCEASDVGFGAVWTATCKIRGLAKIDPSTNRVVRHVRLGVPIALDGEGSLGAGEGGVWLVTDGRKCQACRVARVDPRTMKVTARVPVKAGAATVRTGAGAVWVANPDKSVVQRIDPDTRKVVRTITTGAGPRFFDVGEGAVWTLNQVDGSVTRIDPASGKTANVDAEVPGEGGDLTAAGGSVWVRGSDKLLARIDPRRNRVVTRYGPSSGSGAVIVGGGAVWISAHDIDTVWRLPLVQGAP
jgi:streptogramin lyase